MRAEDIKIRVDGEGPIALSDFLADNNFPAAEARAFQRKLMLHGVYFFGGGAAALIPVTLDARPDGKPFDAPFVGHDGPIWPARRADMVTRDHIVDRMAQDLGGLIRERGADATIRLAELEQLGWTGDEVRRFGNQAVGHYKERYRRAAPHRATLAA